MLRVIFFKCLRLPQPSPFAQGNLYSQSIAAYHGAILQHWCADCKSLPVHYPLSVILTYMWSTVNCPWSDWSTD